MCVVGVCIGVWISDGVGDVGDVYGVGRTVWGLCSGGGGSFNCGLVFESGNECSTNDRGGDS